jgi:hypothetical protein
MLARFPSLRLVRLWAALLLATIGLQAAGSAPAAAFGRTHGSAFSAGTYEMALFVQRGDRVARQATAPQPLLPLAVPTEVLPARSAVLPAIPAPRPDSTGPPLRDIRSWKPAPRAPPRA